MYGAYTIKEAAERLDELVGRVALGECVYVERLGGDVVCLARGEHKSRPFRPGLAQGRIRVSDDFDQTPEWLVDAFEGVDADQPPPRAEAG